jgi:hypothetical protein
MSDNNINPTILLEAVRDILINDSILSGASYLNGTGKIFTRRKPNNQTGQYLVIECKDIPSSGIAQFSTEVRVFCYTALLTNGQIISLGDLILFRCQEVLNDQQIVVVGLSTISMMTTIVPSFLDETDPSRARGVLRIKIDFVNN